MTRLTPKEIGYIVRKALYLRRLGIETGTIQAEAELDKLEKLREAEEDDDLK
jgi:hypothetical protein